MLIAAILMKHLSLSVIEVLPVLSLYHLHDTLCTVFPLFLIQVVRDRVLETGQRLTAYFKKLEERILRTQKKELTRDLHPKIALPSTPSKSSKGERGLQKKKNIPKHPRNVLVFMSP